MKNKKADIPYCGVRKKVIERAEPEINVDVLDMFMGYIHDRYEIHINKDVMMKKPPWTNNPVMQKYKFTNVRREHDRETIWLKRKIAENGYLTYRQKLINTILFRLFNRHETMEIMGAPFKIEGLWSYVPARNKLKQYHEKHPDYRFFTNAFITGGLKRMMNIMFPQERGFAAGATVRYIKHINENGLMNRIRSAKTPEEVFTTLCEENGIGYFLAYQIFVDFTYIKEFPFSENEFTVAGPGCKNGLDLLFEDRDGMTHEECLFWLRDNWDALIDYTDNWFDPEEEMIDLKHYDRVMNVMSLENCFCELSKYYRIVNNIGIPRNKYKRRKSNGKI